MAEVTAATVRALRDKTGLPMMDCKKALHETNGDEEAALEWLRKNGSAVLAKRTDRETAFGRFGLYCGLDKKVGAMVELKCESAPVAGHDEFITLANDLATALALGGDAATADELLDRPSPSQPGKKLRDVKDEMFNRMREVFNVGRYQRYAGTCGGYSHNSGTVSGVLLEVEGGNDAAAKDICMHVAAMRPAALNISDIDPATIEKERTFLRDQALAEGKPANIVDKMVEGRLRNFYAERALTEQPFVKDDKQSVGKYAESQGGMKLKRFVHWEMGG
jgi:elongation factor Ts